MENVFSVKVLVASFDPTVFGRRRLSDLQSFSPLKWMDIACTFPKLFIARKKLGVPVVLATSANIRKYEKRQSWPKKEAIYFDPFVSASASPVPRLLSEFRKIFSTPATSEEVCAWFKRCFNIAKYESNTDMQLGDTMEHLENRFEYGPTRQDDEAAAAAARAHTESDTEEEEEPKEESELFYFRSTGSKKRQLDDTHMPNVEVPDRTAGFSQGPTSSDHCDKAKLRTLLAQLAILNYATGDDSD